MAANAGPRRSSGHTMGGSSPAPAALDVDHVAAAQDAAISGVAAALGATAIRAAAVGATATSTGVRLATALGATATPATAALDG